MLCPMSSEPASAPRERTREPMSVRGAAFLGIGAMVGAGIFALLAQAGALAGAAVWISFLLAGCIAGALGYTLVRLGVRYPSAGGLVTYLVKGFGNGRMVGVASWLGYFTAILLVGAMIAVAFGEYAARLLLGAGAASAWTKVFASAIVVVMALLNVRGARSVDRLQSVIVAALLVVFIAFIAATLTSLHPHLLDPAHYPSAMAIVSSVAITFFAYLGFAVISFAAEDLRNPERDLPRAMYLALGVTSVLYVAIAIGVFGTLSVKSVLDYGATAIAEAARPALGEAGFTAVSVAALLATASSVNATLYASGGFTSTLAQIGQFPPVFGEASRLGRHAGLLITTIATLVFVNIFNLAAIASVGSAVSLSVFVLLGVAGLRLRGEIGARWWVILAAILGSSAVLVLFAIETFKGQPKTFWATVAVVVLALTIDALWTHAREGRSPTQPGRRLTA